MNRNINERAGVIEIDVWKLLLSYLRKWWLIALCILVGGGGAWLYTYKMITPMYQASITVYVNNLAGSEHVDSITSSNLQAAQKLVSTYATIIKSDTVLDGVIARSGLSYTADDIRERLSTQQVGDTEIFKIFVLHEEPQEAARLANAIAEEAPAVIEDIVVGSSAKIVDYAKIPDTRHSPSYILNTVVGAVVGMVLAMAYVTLCTLLDVRIKNEEDLKSLFNYPVLGQIPRFDASASGQAGAYGMPYVPGSSGKEGSDR